MGLQCGPANGWNIWSCGPWNEMFESVDPDYETGWNVWSSNLIDVSINIY